MALNKAVLKTRTLTAVVFAAVMLAGLFINRWIFIVLCLIITAGCLYEFLKMAKKQGKKKYYLFAIAAPFYIIMPMLMLTMLGITVIITTTAPYRNEIIYSPLLPCAVILSIWINDTMAYIVGSLIGKTPLSPISPKKTLEGTIGGAILCVTVMGLLGYFLPVGRSLALQHWLCIAAICAVFGTLGDLLESKLKRNAGLKDSGSFMPGHGGFLDRFDSLLIATPFVWLYAMLFIL
ncbi:MAG: phosphatidate cytidylyltransferase [Ferruginibacter sp.]